MSRPLSKKEYEIISIIYAQPEYVFLGSGSRVTGRMVRKGLLIRRPGTMKYTVTDAGWLSYAKEKSA
jgi:hypothetical protein